MPYEVRKSGCPEDKPYGVFKTSDGKRMGCHKTAEGAGKQIAAIEANESKEMVSITPDHRLLTLVVEKAAMKRENGMDFPARDFAFVPDPSKPSTWKLRLTAAPGKISKAQLGRASAALSPSGFRGQRVRLPASAVSAVKRRILAEYRKLGMSSQNIPNSVKETKDQSGLMLWKDKSGKHRWLAIYSNNFRDDDYPSEIISDKSQRTFEYLVDNKMVDYPEIWLWHTKGTAWGKADMVTYSSGFAIAVGYVYPGKEHIAKSMKAAIDRGEDIGVSHGMPVRWILRNSDDPTVIDFHITNEISPLDRLAAANKMTGFAVFNEVGDKNMPFPEDKIKWLSDVAGLPLDTIKQLENALDSAGKSATDAGVESKEAGNGAAANVQDSNEGANDTAEGGNEGKDNQSKSGGSESQDEDGANKAITREELAEVFVALANQTKEANAAVVDRLGKLEKQVADLTKSDAEKVKGLAEDTPTDSLYDLIARKSAIGNDGAALADGDELHNQGPTEKEASESRITLSPFVDKLMRGAHNGAAQ